MIKVAGGPKGNQGPTWPGLRPQYLTLISPIFHFIIRNISVGGFLLKDLKNLLLIGFSWLNNYFPSKVRVASDHQKNGNILLSSRPLPALVPESHYIHVCVFCVLITCGPGLTGMFYRVSLYLIVCHLSSYWVTSCHTMTGRASHLCHTTLGLIWLICVRLSSVGLWRDWRSVSSNINHPVLMHSLTWEWQGLVLSTENLPRHHCWLFQPPFEDSLARRAIRCWLSFYNWVIIFLLLLFWDFLTTGLTLYFKLTRQCLSMLVSLSVENWLKICSGWSRQIGNIANFSGSALVSIYPGDRTISKINSLNLHQVWFQHPLTPTYFINSKFVKETSISWSHFEIIKSFMLNTKPVLWWLYIKSVPLQLNKSHIFLHSLK